MKWLHWLEDIIYYPVVVMALSTALSYPLVYSHNGRTEAFWVAGISLGLFVVWGVLYWDLSRRAQR